MRELLQQMQHTTALLLNRIGQFPSAPPQSRLEPIRSAVNPLPAVIQHPTPAFQTDAPRMLSGSRQLLAPSSHTLPATLSPIPSAQTCHIPPALPNHTPPAPPCHIPPAQTCHYQAVAPRNTVYQPQPDNVQVQLSRLFRHHQRGVGTGVRKRKRETPWSHTFICLPDPQWTCMPTVEEARYFSSCGLGRKTVWFPHNEGDHLYFSEHLFSAFPALRDGGGFVLARGSRGKVLEQMPIPPEGYSVSFVRSASTRAPLYIIPLQRSLTLSHPSVEEVPKVMETCLSCQSLMPLCDLADHILECTGKEESRNDEDYMDDDLAVAIQQSLEDQVAPVQQQSIIVIEDEVGAAAGVINAQRHTQEQVMVEVAELDENTENEGTSESPDLKTVLGDLEKGLLRTSSPIHNCLNVCREFLLEGSFRAFRRTHFNPCHRLMITFVDDEGQSEGAVDDGGPSREYLRLLISALRDSRYFEGPESSKNLSLVPRGLEFGDYKVIGQMLSLALLQGGVRPSFLSSRLYALLCRQQTGPVSVEEVGDWELRQHLDKIKAAENLQEAQRAVEEGSPALHALGCARSLTDMESRQALIEEAAKAHVEGRTKAALDQ
ncbi:uncharacterized protein LOC121633001 [Melanotaenia boesemani]|uniref:uncharacterized protein LOC121633001 n=1 Tax=Melanotaenia boesemani TaxID=1250792 RepID=UPI001C05C3CE|nr:uncharacterized protein LOC121633001 [Melanotaenia boesemani]